MIEEGLSIVTSDLKRGEAPPEAGELPSEVQERLGAKLRESYANIVAEPLPTRFATLLADLVKSSAKDGGQK